MNKFDELKVKEIISLVKDNPCLYNRQHKNYKISIYKEKIWQNIAESVNADANDCKSAWKSLRDQFGRALKERKRQSSLKGYLKTYKYFDDLSFLQESMKRRSYGNKYESLVEDVVMSNPLSLSEWNCTDTYIDKSSENNEVAGITTTSEDMKPENNTIYFDPSQIHPIKPILNESTFSSNTPLKKEKYAETDEHVHGFMRHVINEMKEDKEDNTDIFFRSMSSLVKEAKLSVKEWRRIQLRIQTFITKELDKIDEGRS